MINSIHNQVICACLCCKNSFLVTRVDRPPCMKSIMVFPGSVFHCLGKYHKLAFLSSGATVFFLV